MSPFPPKPKPMTFAEKRKHIAHWRDFRRALRKRYGRARCGVKWFKLSEGGLHE